jgi:hypothetical protein
MTNPEQNQLFITKTGKATEMEIKNPKSLGLSALQEIAMRQMQLKNREIIKKEGDEEISLLDDNLREIQRRTMLFGVPAETFSNFLTSEMYRTNSIVIREPSY